MFLYKRYGRKIGFLKNGTNGTVKKVVFQPQKMLILLCDIIVFSLKQTRTSVAFFISSLQRQNEEVLVNVLDKKVT